jgi:hypothetical protein
MPGVTVELMKQDASQPLFVVVADELVSLDCEQTGSWSVYSGDLLGSVSGARCANATRVAQLADGALADPSLAKLVARGAANLPALALTREKLDDGSTLSYFQVLAIGHGVVVLWTATLIDKANTSAIVVQATTSQGCPEVPQPSTPRLCRDPKGLVIEVAKTLAAGPRH